MTLVMMVMAMLLEAEVEATKKQRTIGDGTKDHDARRGARSEKERSQRHIQHIGGAHRIFGAARHVKERRDEDDVGGECAQDKARRLGALNEPRGIEDVPRRHQTEEPKNNPDGDLDVEDEPRNEKGEETRENHPPADAGKMREDGMERAAILDPRLARARSYGVRHAPYLSSRGVRVKQRAQASSSLP